MTNQTDQTKDEICYSACDAERVETLPLTDLPEALATIADFITPIRETQVLSLSEALGHILAEPATSPIPLPVNNNSAVDGYAVKRAALKDGLSLPIGGRIAAGDDAAQVPASSVCARILTGAMVPDWADAVIMQEETKVSEDGTIASFTALPKDGANIRRQGEDVAQGSQILAKGTEIDARHIALAAASGLAQLPVLRPIRVALLATGSELNRPGNPLPPGGIYDSNTPMVAAMLHRPSVSLTIHHTLADDYDTIRRTLAALAQNHDLLLTSGGMSVSDEDHIRRAIAAEGGTFKVQKMRIKPGKPLGFGKVKDCVFVGLPGNPFAAYMGVLLFANAALAALAGRPAEPQAP